MAQIPQNIQSNTLEGLFLETAFLMQKYENSNTTNPQKLNAINIVIDSNDKTATITSKIPIDYTPDQNGGFIVAYPYLVDPPANPQSSTP